MPIRFLPPTYLAPSRRFAPDFLWAVSASGAVNYSPSFAAASVSATIAGGRHGLEARGDGTNALWSSASAITTSDGAGSGDFTLLSVSNPPADATRFCLIGQREATTFAQTALYANMDNTGAASSGSVGFYTYGGAASIVASASKADGHYHVFAGRRSGTDHSCWRDGFNVTNSSLTVRDVHTATQRLAVGAGWSNGTWTFPAFSYFGFQLSAGWNRALTDGELLELGRNPWLLFNEPRRPLRRMWAVSGATPYTLTVEPAAITVVGQTVDLEVTLSLSAAQLTLVGQTVGMTVGESPADEQPTGGWAAYNAYDAERQRRKRKRLDEEEDEREALADRLEAQLAAEGLVEPDPAVAQRIVVREYAQVPELLNRRAQRAVDYALRAKTELSWALAAREIARQEEDEELALLLLLAAA